MGIRNSRPGVRRRRAIARRRASGLALAALLAASPAAIAAGAGCPDDVGAVLRSMRQLRSSAAKKRILDPLLPCLSVAEVVRELRAFRPSPAHGRAFRELSLRRDLTAQDAAHILEGSHTLASIRARKEVVVNLIEEAERDLLMRHARTLPGRQLQDVLERLVALDTAVNRPPVPRPQSLRTRIDEPIEIRLTTNERGWMAYEIVSGLGPRHGTLEPVDGSADTVRYRPHPGFTGSDEFRFHANDGQLRSTEPATVTITVRGRRR